MNLARHKVAQLLLEQMHFPLSVTNYFSLISVLNTHIPISIGDLVNSSAFRRRRTI